MTSGEHTKGADLLALADRVEKLTGPDRGIAEEIALLMLSEHPDYKHRLNSDWDKRIAVTGWLEVEGDPTASLDAAMTLLPEGWRCGFEQAGVADHVQTPMAWCWPFASSWEPDWQLGYDSYKGHDQGAQSIGATPALALTAVCLRALAKSCEAQAGGGA